MTTDFTVHAPGGLVEDAKAESSDGDSLDLSSPSSIRNRLFAPRVSWEPKTPEADRGPLRSAEPPKSPAVSLSRRFCQRLFRW